MGATQMLEFSGITQNQLRKMGLLWQVDYFVFLHFLTNFIAYFR